MVHLKVRLIFVWSYEYFEEHTLIARPVAIGFSVYEPSTLPRSHPALPPCTSGVRGPELLVGKSLDVQS